MPRKRHAKPKHETEDKDLPVKNDTEETEDEEEEDAGKEKRLYQVAVGHKVLLTKIQAQDLGYSWRD